MGESDAGGELTIDHIRPRSHSGSNHPDNFVYCCHRCNGYKGNYYSTQPNDPQLWNPRIESSSAHFLLLDDGTFHPRASTGKFTLQRLRLNRPQLVAYRQRQRERSGCAAVLEQYRDLSDVLERLYQQQAALLVEQESLLSEYRTLIELLLDEDK